MSEIKIILSGEEADLQPAITTVIAVKQLLDAYGIVPLYGIPVTTFQESRVFKPQVQLFFFQEKSDVKNDFRPIKSEITFRIMNRESENISQSEVKFLAERIRDKFGKPPFKIRRGKIMVTYVDKAMGYDFQLRVSDESEGIRVIEQLLDIRGHSVDRSKINTRRNAAPAQAYPEIPDKKTILGTRQRMPRKFAVGTVTFKYALLHIWGLAEPICLVDLSGGFAEPVVFV